MRNGLPILLFSCAAQLLLGTSCRAADSLDENLTRVIKVVRDPKAAVLGVAEAFRKEVMFATNRVVDRDAVARPQGDEILHHEEMFFPEEGGLTTYGTAMVSYPGDRRKGQQNYPGNEGEWNPLRYFTVRRIALQPEGLGLDEFSRRHFDGATGPSLLYVHGFNNSFYAATTRVTQLAVDLGVAGVPMVFTWPGDHGTWPSDYERSERDALEAAPSFARVVSRLGDVFPSSFNVVAHSMGSRIVLPAWAKRAVADGAVRQQGARPDAGVRPDAMIIAAGDVGRREFDTLIPSIRSQGIRVVVYCGLDLALGYSSMLHADERLGTSCKDHHDVQGVDFVQFVPYPGGYNHAFFIDQAKVLDDIQAEMMHPSEPENGGYREIR